MSCTPPLGDGPADRPGRTLRLILELEPGDAARGTIGPVDGSRVGFHGWIGLMSAIQNLCSDAGQSAGPSGRSTGSGHDDYPAGSGGTAVDESRAPLG
jgi:hypothetical protein